MRFPKAGDAAALLVMTDDGRQIIAHLEITRFRAEQHGDIELGRGLIAIDGMEFLIEATSPGFIDYIPHPSDNTGIER